jgi:Co/Zn/Cd efflux system component
VAERGIGTGGAVAGGGGQGPYAAEAREPRPRQVKVATVLMVLFGILGLFVTWLLLSVLNDDADHGETVKGGLYTLCYLQFALSSLQIISGVLVWQGRPWARYLAITLCSINIAGDVFSLAAGARLQAISGVAINVGLIRMLMRYEVVDWCSPH